MKDLLAANNATAQTVLLPGKNICLPRVPRHRPPQRPGDDQAAGHDGSQAGHHPAEAAPTTQPPTPAVTSAPTTTQPQPPPNTYTKAQVAQIIRDVWPDDLEDEAIRIATRESNLDPDGQELVLLRPVPDLLQPPTAPGWRASASPAPPSSTTRRVNASAALALYNISGWAPWATAPPATTTTTVSV